MKYLIFLIILIISNFKLVFGYGESDSSGLPSYQERENFNVLNLVRMFPQNFKADYMSSFTNQGGMLVSYPAVPPLYYDNTMNKLALSHSQDMAMNNCFQHNSCDGTSIWTRFDSYITCKGASGAMSENIAAGSTPFEAIRQLVCDETNGACANDKSSNDGHRQSIMSATYKTLGVGWYVRQGSTYTNYVTQDFNEGNCNSPKNPIYSAFHTFISTDSAPQFIALFYSTSTSVSSFNLVFADGTTTSLPLKYGTSSAGAYIKTLPYVACQQYYFGAVTADSKTVRYPDTGFLQVSKSSSCSGWVQNGNNVQPTTDVSLSPCLPCLPVSLANLLVSP